MEERRAPVDLAVLGSALPQGANTANSFVPATVTAGIVYETRVSVAIDTDEDLDPLISAIEKCQNIQVLELCGYSFGVKAAARLGVTIGERCSSLKIAQWADIFVSRNKPEVPEALKSLINGVLKCGANLTVLNLSDNAFGALGLQSVVSYFKSRQSVHLQELILNNNGLGISGAKVLSSALSSPPPNLRRLEIGRNRLENPGACAIAEVLKKVTTLEHLSLPQNGIYYVGVEALATALSNNRKLQVLNLNDNTVGPKGAKALLQILPDMKELKTLNLGDCLLKNEGAKLIFQALAKPNLINLETLDLSFNEISMKSKSELESGILWRCNVLIFLEGNRFNTSFKGSLIERANGELDFGKEGSDEEDEDDEDEEDEDEEEGYEEEDDNNVSQLTAEDDDEYNESAYAQTMNLVRDAIVTPAIINNDVLLFLNYPSKENYLKLGVNPTYTLLNHIQNITEEDVYADEIVQIIFKLSLVNQDPKDVYSKMASWLEGNSSRVSLIANAFLVHLGFIKSETKNKKLAGNTDASVKSFTAAVKTSLLPSQLRDMILFVIKDKCAKDKKVGSVDYNNHKEIWSNGL